MLNRVGGKEPSMYGKLSYLLYFLFSFSSLLYSFFVNLINDPCCGPLTPFISTGSEKLRMLRSARQMR